MPRKPLADKGVQTSVRLPRDLYDRLISAAGDKGIGEEIRQRVEASFSPAAVELADPRLRDLLAAISRAAVAGPVAARSSASMFARKKFVAFL